MRKLLDIENPFFQFLSRVGDLMVLNVLFLICCVPVVTAGASVAGMIKVCQGIVADRGAGTVKTFLAGFKGNFKQATAAWLVMLAAIVGLCCNLLLIHSYLTGAVSFVLRCVVYFLMAVVLGIGAFIFPLIVRYENTLSEHFRNAVILAMWKLPRTVAVVALELVPVVIFFVSLINFFKTLAFWAIIGCAVVCYLDCVLLAPVLKQLEKPATTKENEEE